VLRQTVYLFFFLIVAFALFVTAERMFSPLFQQCIDQREHDGVASCANNETGCFSSVAISSYIGCSGKRINSLGNAITALATLMIAAFTWILWLGTTEQADFAREAHILDKRAAIFAVTFAQSWYPVDPATGLYNWSLRPVWRNTGDTPTKDLTLHVECEIRDATLPLGYPFAYQEADVGTGTLGPKMDMFGGPAPRYPTVLTPEDILQAQQGRRFIYLWGWAKYHDIFPNTPRHITHFCWLITSTGDPFDFIPNVQGPPPTRGALTFGLVQHPEGNYNKDEEPE